MATLAVVEPVLEGVVFTPVAAAAGGDQFLNDGDTLLYVLNASGAPITVTIAAQYVDGNVPLTDVASAVAAGGARIFGPFPPRYFNNSLGLVSITYSGVTTLTVKPFRQR